ncbi:hypothetical protein SPM15_12195, partial [Enterobacter hormaechei subsp. xiangfangensis]
LKMPAFEWVHVQLHQQKGMISLSPPTICNSAFFSLHTPSYDLIQPGYHGYLKQGLTVPSTDAFRNRALVSLRKAVTLTL